MIGRKFFFYFKYFDASLSDVDITNFSNKKKFYFIRVLLTLFPQLSLNIPQKIVKNGEFKTLTL